MTFPEYTAVVPHYNHAGTISACLESILAQTAAPSRVVVVDDRSTGEQYTLLQEAVAALGSPLVRLVRLDVNAGPSTARNTGWAASVGQYVAFCDADDTWAPDKMETQFAAMAATGTRMSSGQWSGTPGVPRPPVVLRTRGLLARNPVRTSSVVLPASLACRFDESMRYCEDLKLWISAVHETGGMVLVDAPVFASGKEHWWVGGLSSRQRLMVAGEVKAYRDSRRAGIYTRAELVFAVAFLAARVARRWARIGVWRVAGR